MSVKTKIIIEILIAIVAIAVGFYFSYRKYYLPQVMETPLSGAEPAKKIGAAAENIPEIKPAAPKTETLFLGFKLYKNSEFGFEIQHPVSWTVTEEINENVRGEMVKEFFFKKPNSDLRFAILPRDGLSYGVETTGTSTPVYVGGFLGMQTQYILKDSRRLWLLFPQTGFLNWLQDLGRIDALTSAKDPIGDSRIFEQMLNSFKFVR